MVSLQHNYHELNRLQKWQYWLLLRRQLSAEDRFFFEGHRPLPGQMYLEERKVLHATILSRKPRYCYEIGTASGGGSTFFIASAFRALGTGKLVSLEAMKAMSERAARRYDTDLKHLRPYVEFLAGTSPNSFLPYIHDADGSVECVFLDGSDSPDETVGQYEFFLPFARKGTILMAHDWNDVKMSLLRPVIEKERSWRLMTALDEPLSVGFMVYRFEEVPA